VFNAIKPGPISQPVFLKPPSGAHDDLAVAFIIGLGGLKWESYKEKKGEGVSVIIEPPDIFAGMGEVF